MEVGHLPRQGVLASKAIIFLSVMGSAAFGFQAAFAQQPGGLAGQGIPAATFATMLVSVRSSNGGPLAGGAFVSISSDFTSVRQTAATRDAGTATFSNIRTGDYNVEVQAAGYQTATEHASMLGRGFQLHGLCVHTPGRRKNCPQRCSGQADGEPALAIGD
jgi:Carboxypeptidase regulatory-like domain